MATEKPTKVSKFIKYVATETEYYEQDNIENEIYEQDDFDNEINEQNIPLSVFIELTSFIIEKSLPLGEYITYNNIKQFMKQQNLLYYYR